MFELSFERVDQIMHKETPKTEDLPLILRSVYLRYMRLYEKYYADIDALNDDQIAELKKYHKETRNLMKYYYLDIPLDISYALSEYDNEHISKLLGAGWHKTLFDSYRDFKAQHEGEDKSKTRLKEEFTQQKLTDFYEAMDYIFREAFGTGSKTAENTMNGIANLLFGENE